MRWATGSPNVQILFRVTDCDGHELEKAFENGLFSIRAQLSTPVHASLTMIVKNEAEDLSACLESVKGLFDEPIIVDSGGGDGTPERAMCSNASLSATGIAAPPRFRRNAIDVSTGCWASAQRFEHDVADTLPLERREVAADLHPPRLVLVLPSEG